MFKICEFLSSCYFFYIIQMPFSYSKEKGPHASTVILEVIMCRSTLFMVTILEKIYLIMRYSLVKTG